MKTNTSSVAAWAVLMFCLLLTGLPCSNLAAKEITDTRIIDGISFHRTAKPSLVSENSLTTFPVNAPVRYLYFLGMTNSLDQGSPGWGAPAGERNCRFFLGSTIGSISLAMADGTSRTLPLTFGYNVWWWAAFSRDGYRAPFDTATGDRLLTSTLRLFDTGRKPPEAFIMTVDVGNADVSELTISDSAEFKGFPVISAITAELDGKSLPVALSPNGPVQLPPINSTIEKRKAISLSSKIGDECTSAVAVLRSVLYSSQEQFDSIDHFPAEIPPGYSGPRVIFSGTKEAEILTNLFSHNLMDMLTKSEDGRYHTSTPGAPNWGRYKGFGTWKNGVGWNQDRSWSRDFGPALIELAELGYQSRAEGLCEYAWKWMRWFTDVDMRYPDGTPVPPHWIRSINTPAERSHNPVREGVQENDGHGLLMLATYKTWQRAQNRDAWARAHWQGFTDAAEWICWQFEHPEISGATEVMRTVSECSRKPEKSPYAEFPCAMGLLSHAEIADSIGETSSAVRWRDRAQKMLAAMPHAYQVKDPDYGVRWDNAFAWSGHYPALGPLIDQADFNGLRPAIAMPQWLDVNLHTYLWQLHEHKGQPIDYHAVAFGYGQAFMAESALLLDRLDEATALVNTMCRLAWFPGFKPWIIPEGVEWTQDRKFWFRTSDLGNGVQQANFIKTVRLMIGVDDSTPAHLKFLPRLPDGWKSMEVSDFAALTRNGLTSVSISYIRPRQGQYQFTLKSTADLDPFTVRLGPFPDGTTIDQLSVRIENTTGTVSVGQEGLRSWMYLDDARLVEGATMQIKVIRAETVPSRI